MTFPSLLADHGWRPLTDGDRVDREQAESALRSVGAWGLFGLDAAARRLDEPSLWLFELRSSVGSYLVVRHPGGAEGTRIIFHGELRQVIDDDTVCLL